LEIAECQGLVTLTLVRVILHTVMHHSSTSTCIPNVIEIEETFCGRTDGRTGGRTFETELIRSTRSAKTHGGTDQRPVTSGRGELTQGTAGVASIACATEHYSRENPAWHTYTTTVAILCSVRRPTDVATLTFQPPKIIGFPGLIVEHLYVKFSGPSSIAY